MALQIANPRVLEKVERLARQTGLSKTSLIDRALDRLAADLAGVPESNRLRAILAQIDQIPQRPDAFDPLDWDEMGLPK